MVLSLAVGPFSDCLEHFARNPSASASAECFYTVAREEGRWDEAVAHMSDLLRGHPGNDWLRYYLGNVYWWSDPIRAIEWYEQAAEGFAASGELRGELMARGNARNLLMQEGRSDEAELQVQRVVDAAAGTLEPELLSRANILQAWHLWQKSEDLGRAYRLLREAEAHLFPDGPYRLRKECLLFLGNVATELGDLEASIEYGRALERLAQSEGDQMILAAARFGIANSLRLMLEESPRETGRLNAVALARNALETAARAGHREAEVMGHRLVGALLTSDEAGRDEARMHFERCLELAKEYGLGQERGNCLWEYSRLLGKMDPEQARSVANTALSIALEFDDPAYVAFAWRQKMRVAWLANDAERALEESVKALDAVEKLRDKQVGERSRAGLFSKWTADYYFVSGQMLRTGSSPGPPFQVVERVRARTLVDSSGGDGPVGLETLRTALSPTEAVLSFQLGLWKDLYGEFGGGAFVTVITSSAASVVPLPDRMRIDSIVDIFLGLVERRDGSEMELSQRLYDILLRDALRILPASVEEIVVIPDDVLHRLPFGALRDSLTGEPMASRFELSVVPSATLWLRWRGRDSGPLEPFLVAFADPTSHELTGDEGQELSFRETSEKSLGPLPYARREGRNLMRRFGPGSKLFLGDDASENRIKQMELDSYAVMHFAVHAIADERHPDRTAVFLTPGAENEDGALTLDEIATLDLDGQLVGLSACQTAAGALLRGEGVLSLARGFFRAGARAVVASLWPLRDDEAARLFDSYYGRIAAGWSVSAALRFAQREAMKRGLPTAAWASLIVMGDGGAIPVPGGIDSGASRRTLWWAVALFSLFVSCILVARLRSWSWN